MKDIKILLEEIKLNNNCIVRPTAGNLNIPKGLNVPKDLLLFYELCGGIDFFIDSEIALSIVSPIDFVRANPIIVGEECEYDISYNWFIIATDNSSQYITIDLDQARCGKCYDSFWDRHGVPDSNPIIAQNFIEFINLLYYNSFSNWYWLEETFVTYGDAYSQENS